MVARSLTVTLALTPTLTVTPNQAVPLIVNVVAFVGYALSNGDIKAPTPDPNTNPTPTLPLPLPPTASRHRRLTPTLNPNPSPHPHPPPNRVKASTLFAALAAFSNLRFPLMSARTPT